MGNLDFSANADQLKELAAYIASQINVPTIGIGGGYAPIGSINFFDATVAPQDWLACDGSVYNIADYPQLAEWYATQHGASNFYGGDGTTTFAVPDLQGEFLRGTGTNSHANQGSGANVGVHQDGTEIPAFSSSNGAFIAPRDNNINNKDSQFGSSTFAYINVSSGGPDTTYYTSRPTNTSFLICVKAVVAGEVYSTEERVVGTWIDGKKLYQKTVVTAPMSISASATNSILDLSNFNVDAVIEIKGLISNSAHTEWYIMPYIRDNQMGGYLYFNKSTDQLIVGTNSATWSSAIINATICYTKTTD